MKSKSNKIAAAALAVLAFASPLGGAAFADPPHHSDGRDSHDNRRGNDRHERWDGNRHNGYTINGRWYYGPPPSAYQTRSDFRPGYHEWRRGDRLPSYYRNQFRTVDYRREHLRAPPRGYHYVRDNRGELLLVAVATGVILSIISR